MSLNFPYLLAHLVTRTIQARCRCRAREAGFTSSSVLLFAPECHIKGSHVVRIK
jgi:hypothetical protein